MDPHVAKAWKERDQILRAKGFPGNLPESFKTDRWLRAHEQAGAPGINPLVFTALAPPEWVAEFEEIEKQQAAKKVVNEPKESL